MEHKGLYFEKHGVDLAVSSLENTQGFLGVLMLLLSYKGRPGSKLLGLFYRLTLAGLGDTHLLHLFVTFREAVSVGETFVVVDQVV